VHPTLLSSSETRRRHDHEGWKMVVSTLLSSSETRIEAAIENTTEKSFHTTKFFWNVRIFMYYKKNGRVSTLLSSSETHFWHTWFGISVCVSTLLSSSETTYISSITWRAISVSTLLSSSETFGEWSFTDVILWVFPHY